MYSLAHVHLLLNHIPIIVTALGLLVLVIAMTKRRDDLARVSFWLFVGSAFSALPTYLTGDSAEHAVEDMPGVTEALIHAHEDAAVWGAIIVGILGVFALWALWRYRRPAALPAWVVRTALADLALRQHGDGTHRVARRGDPAYRSQGRVRGTGARRAPRALSGPDNLTGSPGNSRGRPWRIDSARNGTAIPANRSAWSGVDPR
jgi:hypothetical protein